MDKGYIYFAKFNSDNGSLNLLGSFKSKENPSFIHINNNGTNLYSISENYDNEGGVASSYKIEEDGSLKVLNHQFLSHDLHHQVLPELFSFADVEKTLFAVDLSHFEP